MHRRFLAVTFFSLLLALPAAAVDEVAHASAALQALAETPGVSGYEGHVSVWLAERLRDFLPQVDNLGNVVVQLGSGAPHRLLVASIDEPGYVVSAITDDGYLRVQRLPQRGLHPWFELLHAAQPIQVQTRSGKLVPGVVAGRSTHLHRDFTGSETTDNLDSLYIDIGAGSREEARVAGVDVLDPITLEKHSYELAHGQVTAPFIGDRAGAAALVRLVEGMDPIQLKGTLTVAFVTQHYMGNIGLNRVLKQTAPDEILFIERVEGSQARPGDGVLVTSFENSNITLATELLAVARNNGITLKAELPEAPPSGRYSGRLALPERTAVVGVPVLFPQTPAATVDAGEVAGVEQLLALYLGVTIGRAPQVRVRSEDLSVTVEAVGPDEEILRALTPVYGVSGYEGPVVEAIYKALPDWAKEWAFLDAGGNFILPLGEQSKKPSLVFIAHMDEIGWTVEEIQSDGRLRLAARGGFIPEHYLGHAVLVHAAGGEVPAVLELPVGYQHVQHVEGGDVSYLAYTGARTAEEVEGLGIHSGDSVTVPKAYRRLAGTRANGRSFDDRVGATALVAALSKLDPKKIDREVTFVWSTREEIGLGGAKHFAARAGEAGDAPAYGFAVDTFVSADSPLESPRYALGRLGEGFVVRAVDHSNVTPRRLVDCVVKRARDQGIPAQYGITGGGNDGAVFVPYGSIDIPLAWSLRYSHSAAEVIDLRDLEALSRIVALLAQQGPECSQ